MSEKIKLQVGDHAFTTSRETLCMRKGSMLEAMFSGRHSIKPEEDGSIFIDRDGEHFKLILNYLRDGKLPSGLSNDTREALAAEAEYYQLEDLVERQTPSPTAQNILEYKTITVVVVGQKVITNRSTQLPPREQLCNSYCSNTYTQLPCGGYQLNSPLDEAIKLLLVQVHC